MSNISKSERFDLFHFDRRVHAYQISLGIIRPASF